MRMLGSMCLRHIVSDPCSTAQHCPDGFLEINDNNVSEAGREEAITQDRHGRVLLVLARDTLRQTTCVQLHASTEMSRS